MTSSLSFMSAVELISNDTECILIQTQQNHYSSLIKRLYFKTVCTPVFADIADCTNQTCGEHGACHEEFMGGAICKCDEGYTGTSCEEEINPCYPNPCANGGKCEDTNGFNCSCADGFSGITCTEGISLYLLKHIDFIQFTPLTK